MIDGVEFDSFEEWLRLPFEPTDDELAADLLAEFASDPAPEEVKRALAANTVTIRNQVRDSGDASRGMFGAWVLLEPGGRRLRVHSIVMGMLVPVARGTSAPQFIEHMLEGIELHQPVELESFAAPLGTAHSLRARRSGQGDRGLEVVELAAVFWLPDDDVAIVLSTLPMPDLVEAAETVSALTQLARTARPIDSSRG